MQISMDELEAIRTRIAVSRVRNSLYSQAMSGLLTDESLMPVLPTGMWRRFGYHRVYDYLVMELGMPHERAKKLTAVAMGGGHERNDLYSDEKQLGTSSGTRGA